MGVEHYLAAYYLPAKGLFWRQFDAIRRRWKIKHTAATQTHKVTVVIDARIVATPPFAKIQFHHLPHLDKVVDGVVDGGEGDVGHDLLHAVMDVLGRRVLCAVSQGLKYQAPLRRDFEPSLPQGLTKLFDLSHR
jgi:hypothetical protein